MNVLHAALLGVIQGATEFLPVSSDGHLAVAYYLLGEKPDLTFEVFLHGATLLAMIAYFRSDIIRLLSSLLPANKDRKSDRRLVVLILVGTAISGVIALGMAPYIEGISASMTWVGLGFLGTATLLTLGEALSRRAARLADPSDLGPLRAGLVGALQGLAVLPGVSRSGSTIAAGMFAGLSREAAARFSFLLGMPIIALAAAKDTVDLLGGNTTLPGVVPSIVGFVAAGVSGYLAIAGLLALVKRHSLYWFAAYTAVLGTAMLLLTTVFARG
ncbi:MAG: undecaprenyl-diphosphate phosphatase [Actinobacteria bacterium]|nr:MAG: undecaprenyl-diphosphate phosphatase [Actinomycetota bacterium]